MAPVRAARNIRITALCGRAVAASGFFQKPDSKQWRKQHCDEPGIDKSNGYDCEDGERIFASRAPGKADRHKARSRDKRAREHRKGQRVIGKGRGLLLAVARRQPGGHDIDGGHRVIDEKAKGDDQSAERDALKVDAKPFHDGKDDCHRERNRKRNDRPQAGCRG